MATARIGQLLAAEGLKATSAGATSITVALRSPIDIRDSVAKVRRLLEDSGLTPESVIGSYDGRLTLITVMGVDDARLGARAWAGDKAEVDALFAAPTQPSKQDIMRLLKRAAAPRR